MNAIAPGDILLEKYRVERVLGEGGMGVVVAARHIELGELFAFKFLLPQALQYPEAVERFVREARASARLKGEHIAKVHDVGRLPDGRPYMVLEYLAGHDLKEAVSERKQLPVEEAVTYVLQACEAVAEAHALGIVHRDIKPANLFLTKRPNGTPCVKVLDFGISKDLKPEDPEHYGLTSTTAILGSPHYMSPEQMMRTRDVDERTDIWSLGCVLYKLLTGAVPFQAEALTELVGKVLQEEPKPLTTLRRDVPPAVEAVVLRCLAKQKEDRFSSVRELVHALRNAMWESSQPIPVLVSAPPQAPSHTGVNPITGPQPLNTTPGWGATAPGANTAEARRARSAGLIAIAVIVAVIGGLAFGGWRIFRGRPQSGGLEASAPSASSSDKPLALGTGSSAEPTDQTVTAPSADRSAAAIDLDTPVPAAASSSSTPKVEASAKPQAGPHKTIAPPTNAAAGKVTPPPTSAPPAATPVIPQRPNMY